MEINNLTDLIVETNLYGIHYIQKDEYINKKLKSYTAPQIFYTLNDCTKFLIKNGFKKCEHMKYDMMLKVGSITTYATIKEFSLYKY